MALMTALPTALGLQARMIAERRAGMTPELYALLLRCARIGLDCGPIITPEQRALDALLTALEERK